jgi:hypothetical protein
VCAGLSLCHFAVSKTIQKFHDDGVSNRDGQEENHSEEEDSSHSQQTDDASGRVTDEENQKSSIKDHEQNQNCEVDDPNQQTDEDATESKADS